MPTYSENQLNEPFDVSHILLGAVDGTDTTTTPQPKATFVGRSIVAPNGLNFSENTDLSNGNYSRQVNNYYGINDFSLFNPYIHYSSNSASAGNAMSDFGVAGESNALKINVWSFLQEASVRFEIYSRQYR
jgi:hypothetical protein